MTNGRHCRMVGNSGPFGDPPRLRSGGHARGLRASSAPGAQRRGARPHHRAAARAGRLGERARRTSQHAQGHRRTPPEGARACRPGARRADPARAGRDREVLRPRRAALPLQDRRRSTTTSSCTASGRPRSASRRPRSRAAPEVAMHALLRVRLDAAAAKRFNRRLDKLVEDVAGGRDARRRAVGPRRRLLPRRGAPMRRFLPGGLWRHRDFRNLWAAETISQSSARSSRSSRSPLVAIILLDASAFEVSALGRDRVPPVHPLQRFPLASGSTGCAGSRSSSSATSGARRCSARSRSRTSFDALTLGICTSSRFLVGICTVFFDVAYQSYLPSLVERDQLVEGNSKLEISRSVAQLPGPGTRRRARLRPHRADRDAPRRDQLPRFGGVPLPDPQPGDNAGARAGGAAAEHARRVARGPRLRPPQPLPALRSPSAPRRRTSSGASAARSFSSTPCGSSTCRRPRSGSRSRSVTWGRCSPRCTTNRISGRLGVGPTILGQLGRLLARAAAGAARDELEPGSVPRRLGSVRRVRCGRLQHHAGQLPPGDLPRADAGPHERRHPLHRLGNDARSARSSAARSGPGSGYGPRSGSRRSAGSGVPPDPPLSGVATCARCRSRSTSLSPPRPISARRAVATPTAAAAPAD